MTGERGDQFGMLTVLSDAPRNKWNQRMVHCRCDCGRLTTVIFGSIRSGRTQSCGCLKKSIGRMNLTHGMKGATKAHPLYLVWRGIKTRCFNQRCKAFKTYGARGITITDEWRDDPVAFINWCLEHGWTPELTIERIDNDGDYEPSNCEFISKSENTKRRLQRERFDKQASIVLSALSLPS